MPPSEWRLAELELDLPVNRWDGNMHALRTLKG